MAISYRVMYTYNTLSHTLIKNYTPCTRVFVFMNENQTGFYGITMPVKTEISSARSTHPQIAQPNL
jgi:hypothetical protein